VEFDGELVTDAVQEKTPAFAQWKAAALEFDERRYGPLRRQLRWLRPRVPGALRRLASERAVLLGAFDRFGTGAGQPVWLLVPPRDKNASLGSVDAPEESYGVNPDGSLQPRYTRWPEPAARLLVFLYPLPLPKQVDVLSEYGEKIVTVPFPSVVNDAELRTVEGGE
jgi:hypothetical protein